ncbi:AarF/ABC1/UbiB kinase family protein [Polyangium sp. y55x31]|uniref:ABC1 kinase family protein n=1 Tax=Polyangium sp. y55x31 TaxID=3042688 RepID=UPI002482DBAE|nr:AarF/ABC1/UbiB kinase family protein [Polyangium sp. y55x31]MDI1484309.1 AarF/ABC1/UbiB kinase family protein [Polyangium sp. y55x31]
MTDERKIPEGRLGRLARLAAVGARTGASLIRGTSAADTAANKAAEMLGTLRGLAAKAGQMASYVDGMVPEAQREAYETAMRKLRNAAPTSSPAAIRARVEEELGAPIDALFAEWDEQPFASASIGQVHRARLESGREVAVKVQHPGIEKAVESDLENADALGGMVAMLGPKRLEPKAVLAELRARFTEELDYELEARRQRAFTALHRDDPAIRIPEVITERSSKRVLTSELVRGKTLEEACEADLAIREKYADTLWRFVFKGNLVGGMFNADPHPGNYLFQDDGSIIFLDFGCVQPIEGDRLTLARELHLAALRRDEPAFGEIAAKILLTEGGVYERMAVAYSRRCFEPIFASPFRITRSYAASLVDGIRDMKNEVLLKKDGNFVQLPPGMLFMNRLQFGFYSVLARLDVAIDYAAVEEAFLREAGLA